MPKLPTLVPLTDAQKKHLNHLLVSNVLFRLKRTRLLLRLTVDEAEQLIGMKENTLSRFENGGLNFRIATVNDIIMTYKLSYSYIFQHYTVLPTAEEWREMAQLQKQLNRYSKSRGKFTPLTGVQLVLGL